MNSETSMYQVCALRLIVYLIIDVCLQLFNTLHRLYRRSILLHTWRFVKQPKHFTSLMTRRNRLPLRFQFLEVRQVPVLTTLSYLLMRLLRLAVHHHLQKLLIFPFLLNCDVILSKASHHLHFVKVRHSFSFLALNRVSFIFSNSFLFLQNLNVACSKCRV